MKASSSNNIEPSMIIEGFICPECQQDLTSIELLQAHFELFHSKKAKKNGNSNSDGAFGDSAVGKSGLSSVLAKAKTLIAFDDEMEENGQQQAYQNGDQMNSGMSSTSNNNNNPSQNQQLTPAQQLQLQQQQQQMANSISYQFMKQFFNSEQRDGSCTNYTNEFKKFRDNSIGRYVVQTNKLLITLDKLISIDDDMYSDDSKREAHFKSVVSWIADNDVQLCPNCAKSFNLLNRKHHCRLCGAIMCNRCSQFISFAQAKQLTDPDTFVKAHSLLTNGGLANGAASGEFKLRRSDSITSANSYFFKSTSSSDPSLSGSSSAAKKNASKHNHDLDQIYLRLCLNCSDLLEKKYKRLKDKLIKSKFTDYYNELSSCVSETQRLVPVYNKMVDSLNLGETSYQLSNAEDMRHKLVNLFKRSEALSAAILNYGVVAAKKDNETDTKQQNQHQQQQPSNDQLKLQRNIRYFVINYLRENSLNLAQLPTSDEYSLLVKQRERFMIEEARRNEAELARQRRVMDERVANNRRQQQNQSSAVRFNKNASVSIDNTNGWIAPQGSRKDELELDRDSGGDSNTPPDAEALRIQIQLVEGYLEDALKANRREEAQLLQKNLNELLTCLANLN